jgi:hypothetical protein
MNKKVKLNNNEKVKQKARYLEKNHPLNLFLKKIT